MDQREIPFAERRFRNAKFRRGIFLLPALFTSANLLCGYYAVVATLHGDISDFDHAARAIGLAILFDSLDGRIARLTGTNTEFGVQFDSLADVVSFGIAPAVLAYAWGFRSIPVSSPINVEQLGQLGWILCLVFLICCAWRLARFNVQGMAPGGSKFFVGMPTPAAAGVVAAIIHGFKVPLHDYRWSIVWFVLLAALGALMTSTIRYYSFKDLPLTRKQPSLAVIVLLMLIAVTWVYSEVALVLFACTYAATGVALHFVRFFRHRFAPRPANVRHQ
ncbi:MAG: CDP-diacylglycerol--serine O-phosphatidyltransferase [Acidobacteria bacterium]|nr:CDP-diacylglycerol--serine O-phosphatidyltransferase [Acidobacteriota bacterium]MBS1865785.1 CDP-diacylglycerol--serine O-phosphatidyltransferase [Acidobacteriota bacterium]